MKKEVDLSASQNLNRNISRKIVRGRPLPFPKVPALPHFRHFRRDPNRMRTSHARANSMEAAKILYARGNAIRFRIMKRKGSAIWKGGIRMVWSSFTESGVLSSVPYSFAKRFGDEPGTNPEELIGAAHAGCFSMAFSAQLGEAGVTPEKIETTATVTIENVGGGFTINAVHLDVQATIPSLEDSKFQEIAKKAKEGCPVSKLFKADITMDAKLV